MKENKRSRFFFWHEVIKDINLILIFVTFLPTSQGTNLSTYGHAWTNWRTDFLSGKWCGQVKHVRRKRSLSIYKRTELDVGFALTERQRNFLLLDNDSRLELTRMIYVATRWAMTVTDIRWKIFHLYLMTCFVSDHPYCVTVTHCMTLFSSCDENVFANEKICEWKSLRTTHRTLRSQRQRISSNKKHYEKSYWHEKEMKRDPRRIKSKHASHVCVSTDLKMRRNLVAFPFVSVRPSFRVMRRVYVCMFCLDCKIRAPGSVHEFFTRRKQSL